MTGQGTYLEQALQSLRDGQVEKANLMLGELLQLEPSNSAARHLLGIVLLQLSQPQAALDQFDMALRGTPGVAAIQNRWPTGFFPSRNFRAKASFTIATLGVSTRSRESKSRPASNGIRSVLK